MSDDRKIFSQKAMGFADEILSYEVEIGRLADENDKLKELNREMVAIFYRIIDLSWYGETSWNDSPIRECCTAMIAKAGESG